MVKKKLKDTDLDQEDINTDLNQNEDTEEDTLSSDSEEKTEPTKLKAKNIPAFLSKQQVDSVRIKCILTLPKVFFNNEYLEFKEGKIYSVSKELKDILIERKACIVV